MPLTLDRPYSSLLAEFEQEQAIPLGGGSANATPYKDDTSLLPQEEVEGRLDKLEAKTTDLLSQAISRSGWEYAGRARKAKEVDKVKSYGANAYGPILYSLWQEGWALGWADAVKEVQLLAEGNFSAGADLVEFAKKKKNEKQRKALAARARFPRQEGARVENSALRGAIEQRTLRVSGDLDEQARTEIQKHLAAATDSKNPISGKELEKRIEESIGRSAGRSGNPGGSFRNRAKRIAATELMGGYTLAQLSAYRSMGIRYVRWQTYEPPDGLICRVCWSRNGTVHAIDDLIGAGSRSLNRPQTGPNRPGEIGYDPRQYIIPSHPSCRCRWVPMRDDDPRRNERGRDPRSRNPFPLRGVWVKAAAGALGLAALYLLLGTTPGLQVTQSAATLKDIADAGQAARERLRAQPRSTVSVVAGGLNLNDASAKVLQRRFNLTEEQANYLRINLEVDPIADLSELVERVRNGEIPGLTMADLENKILATRPVGGTVPLGSLLDAAALAQSEGMVVESLRNVQVSPRISREMYRDFIQNGPYRDRDDLITRMELRGITIKPRDRNILDQFIRYTPSTVNLDEVRAAIAQTGRNVQGVGRGTPGTLPTDSVVSGTVPRDWVAPPQATPEGPGIRRDPWRVMEGNEAWPFLPGTSTIRARKETQKQVAQRIDGLLAASFPPGTQPSAAVQKAVRDLKMAIGAKLEATKAAADLDSKAIGTAINRLKRSGFNVERRASDGDVRLVPIDGVKEPSAKDLRELDTVRRRLRKRLELQEQIYDQVLEATRLENELRLLIVNEGGRLSPDAPFSFVDELIEFSLPFRSFVERQARYRRRWKMRREEKPFVRRLKRRWK